MPAGALWASVLLLGLMCSLPLVQPRHTNPITSFHSEWLALVIGTAALFPLALRRYSSPLRLPWVTSVPLLLAAVLVGHLLAVRSPYPQQPILAVGYLVWSAGLVMLAALLRRELGLANVAATLAWFLLASGLLNAAAGILQHYEWRGAFESVVATKLGFQVYGNLGQPNHFASHISFALASLLLLHATGRLRARSAIPASAILLFVLSLSGSRSAWVYLASIAVVSFLAYRMVRSDGMRRAMVFAMALLPAFAAAQLVANLPWLAPPTLHITVIDRMFELAATPSERLKLWRVAWNMFLDDPAIGAGWGQFAWHNFMSTGMAGGMALTGLYNHAHNIVLHLLAETGIVGAGIFLAGAAVWVRGAWPLLRTPAGLWTWACASVIGAHSMLEYPLWNAHFLGIACVVAGIGGMREAELSQARLARVAVVGFMAATAWLSSAALLGYSALENTMHARYSDSDRFALDRAHRAMMEVRGNFFLTPYVDVAYARDIALNTQDIGRKLSFTARVMRFAPTGMVAYRHAALLALRGDPDALPMLRRAAACYPTLLDDFAREFARAETGDDAAHARFMEHLSALIAEQRARDIAYGGDENRHFPTKLGQRG